MNMLEGYIESMRLSMEKSFADGDDAGYKLKCFAVVTARAFLDAESTAQCKNRNCRKPVVDDKHLGRKKEYCDTKCRMAERSNRVKNKEAK